MRIPRPLIAPDRTEGGRTFTLREGCRAFTPRARGNGTDRAVATSQGNPARLTVTSALEA